MTGLKKESWIPINYALTTAMYWMADSVLITYANLYLVSRGLTNSVVGVIFSMGAFLMMLLQMGLAKPADQYKLLSMKLILAVTTCLELVLVIGLICAQAQLGLILIYIAILGIEWSQVTFINTLVVEFQSRNVKMDFGPIRAMGSLGYALAAIVAGVIVAHFGVNVIPLPFIILKILFLLVVVTSVNPRKIGVFQRKEKEEDTSGYIVFLRNNKRVALMYVGIFFTFVSLNGTFNFMMQIVKKVGGTDQTIGIASFIGAFSEIPIMFISGWLMRKFTKKKVLMASALFFVVQPLVFLLAKSKLMVLLGQLLQGPSYGLFTIVSILLIGELIDAKDITKGQALLMLANKSLSSIVSGPLVGSSIDNLGIQATLIICMICATIGASIICGACLGTKGDVK